jgi:hypothetical protein
MPQPTFYSMPYLGQQFRRKHNATDAQEGFIVALETGGTFQRDGVSVPDWTATLQYGPETYVHFNARTPITPNAAQWLPVPTEEVLQRYGDVFGPLTQRLSILEGVVKQIADHLDALGEAPAANVHVLQPTRIEETPEAPVAEANPLRRRRGAG